MQKLGAQITFLRRYQLFPAIGIAGEDDVDGDDIESTPEDKAKAARSIAEAEAATVTAIRASFAAAGATKSIDALKAASAHHMPTIATLSNASKAALKRSYIEAERILLTKPNDGEVQ
jgi:hypothetical protein